jgi:hypothetical protein
MLAFIYDTDLEPRAAAIAYAAQILLDELWDETVCLSANAFDRMPDAERATVSAIVSYGDRPPEGLPLMPVIHVHHCGFFGSGYGEGAVPDPAHLPMLEGIPVLYGDDTAVRTASGRSTGADLLASSYFLTTRFEEVLRPGTRDEHDRFPGHESLPARAGFIHRPVVDEYAALLRSWLQELGVELPSRKRRFKVLLTHDVDLLGRYYQPYDPVRTLASALLGRQSLETVRECLAVHCGMRADPMDTFDEMIDLDSRIKAEVYYFFMGGGKSKWDRWYRLRWKRTGRLLQKLIDTGATIGLHSSYDAGRRPTLIAGERVAIEKACGQPVRHNRHHFLGWRDIRDGHAIASCGIDWDSTLGYPDVAGFRLGVCRPIPLFDPLDMRPIGIEEHPLVLMDCSLNRPHYMHLDSAGAEDYALQLLRETRKHDGEFVMLWHNVSFAPAADNYLPGLYRRLVEHLAAAEEGI